MKSACDQRVFARGVSRCARCGHPPSEHAAVKIRAWMSEHLEEHRDRQTREVSLTALVEAWDHAEASGEATLDSDHPAWEIAADLVRL